MIGKPKFEYNDEVIFKWRDEEKEGKVYIVDAYGTFFDDSDVSYDILVEKGENQGLYKHINEKYVRKK